MAEAKLNWKFRTRIVITLLHSKIIIAGTSIQGYVFLEKDGEGLAKPCGATAHWEKNSQAVSWKVSDGSNICPNHRGNASCEIR